MKNIYLSLLSAAVIGSGLFVAFPTFAEEKKPKSEKPAKKKSAFFPFRGKIKSVDAEKSVLTLPGAKGKPDRVFTLVEEAKLTLNGEKAKLGDIKAGMYVGGRAKRISETKVEAHTINVKSKAPERKKPAKKKDS
tara:strand:- start:7 stop:411 length:405 start_codon:yes stop_codon:yes gene_type:complete